ncbi:MAG TPA: VOC family protein [Actinomycetota bacterium]|jgi:predicted enzyme related to lactoylglutathione lyase|nr:VOC family protein [Actinomycetota bacterium]
MALGIDTFTFDCADPMRVASFWGEALGFRMDPESDMAGAYLEDPSGSTRGLFFQPVPESKVAKNRIHPDVRPTESMAAEVARLEGLGASVVGRVDVEGSFWTVMLDPEGNEFCVLRGPKDGWTPPSDE